MGKDTDTMVVGELDGNNTYILYRGDAKMQRSTGLFLIILPFFFIVAKMVDGLLLWEYIVLLLMIQTGCKVLIKD